MPKMITVTARIQTRPSPARDAPEPQRDVIAVEAASYEGGKRQVREQLPEGWIVASWTVDQPDTAA